MTNTNFVNSEKHVPTDIPVDTNDLIAAVKTVLNSERAYTDTWKIVSADAIAKLRKVLAEIALQRAG